MATETKIETKQVEKEIKVCDYCRLISEEDIDDDEEFSEMLLNPEVSSITISEWELYHQDIIECDDEKEANVLLNQLIQFRTENTADLCPNCTDQLFGDEEPVGIRAGTGYL